MLLFIVLAWALLLIQQGRPHSCNLQHAAACSSVQQRAAACTGMKRSASAWSSVQRPVATCVDLKQRAVAWTRGVHGMNTGCTRDVHGVSMSTRDVHGVSISTRNVHRVIMSTRDVHGVSISLQGVHGWVCQQRMYTGWVCQHRMNTMRTCQCGMYTGEHVNTGCTRGEHGNAGWTRCEHVCSRRTRCENVNMGCTWVIMSTRNVHVVSMSTRDERDVTCQYGMYTVEHVNTGCTRGIHAVYKMYTKLCQLAFSIRNDGDSQSVPGILLANRFQRIKKFLMVICGRIGTHT